MTAYDAYAQEYGAGRTGYSNDLYNTLVEFGLSQRQRVLDVGCGSGLASEPLIANDFDVTGLDASERMLDIAMREFPSARWIVGRAETLPFENASFDAVISAQAFHHFDRVAAMTQVARVLRPGGIVAIWWKHLTSQDLIMSLRDGAMRELDVTPIPSGLAGGFKEFYGTPFAEHRLRVIPWRTSTDLKAYLQYERSRKTVRDALGSRSTQYFEVLERRLREVLGEGNPLVPLSYLQFVYLGRAAG